VPIRIKLRAAISEYQRRTGERLTYKDLACKTGLSKPTLESMAARRDYNTRLSTIEQLCIALDCTPGDLLEITTE